MATSLFALLDDIATVLDDVAVLTKVAAGKTAGVLGDDLALNAQQVSGVKADRELPVVFAVFKGSAKNKLILVPAALVLAAFAPFLLTPLLMLGGCYLCFEGFEKIAHSFLHPEDTDREAAEVLAALHDPSMDLVAFEANKIKGAIRTDFVLSAEIIVIAMGTVANADFMTQMLTVIAIAVLMTFGVYGLVALIVKLDDLGLYLIHQKEPKWKVWIGERILDFAPVLMKLLSIVGTAAMFLVGGGILVHGLPFHTAIETLLSTIGQIETWGWSLSMLSSLTINGLTGIAAGAIVAGLVAGILKVRTRLTSR